MRAPGSGSTEDLLHDAVWRYHDAIQRRDGVEDRLRRGEVSTQLYDRSLAAAQAVVQARLQLYRVLAEQGWTPPQTVADHAALDGRLLQEADEHRT